MLVAPLKMVCYGCDQPVSVLGVDYFRAEPRCGDVTLPFHLAVGVYGLLDYGIAIFLGRDAYGIIDVNGTGTVEHIVKQRGYGNDPLNQRSSIGWKAFMCAAILADDSILRVESGSSFSPDVKEAN